MTKTQFLSHLSKMEGSQRHSKVSNKDCRLWANRVRHLDLDKWVPQHGCLFRGKEAVGAFLDWIQDLQCGVDLFNQDNYRLPT